MRWNDLGAAAALVLVLEGILPFLNPMGFRRVLAVMAVMNDRQLRLTGLISMLLGVVLLYMLR
jgi:uncharacterized protein YjeT (DUF2065 family)